MKPQRPSTPARRPDRVDSARAPRLESGPVTDWIDFLADRLADEFLRETAPAEPAP
jgi:hypothetical protein